MNSKLLFLGIFILGLLLRSYYIDSRGIWYDEQASVLIANGLRTNSISNLSEFTNTKLQSRNTLPSVLEATIDDNGNSFAFNFLLHYWMLIFGTSDLSARSLALLFGLLTMLLAYKFSSELFNNKKTGLLVAFLFAMHPLFISTSFLCRAYSMGIFFSLLSTYFFYHIITSRSTGKTYIFYGLSVAISLVTHYLTSYVFIAHGIIFLLSIRDKKIWAKFIAANIFVVAMFSVWMIIGGSKGMKVLKVQNLSTYEAALKYSNDTTSLAKHHFMLATKKNVVTGCVEIWLVLFGNQLEQFFQVRKIAVLLILPFFLIFYLIRLKKQDPVGTQITIALLILTFIQTIYATMDAIRNGHNKPFQVHYASFAVPYAVMLLGYAISVCFEKKNLKVPTIIASVAIIAIMFISCIPNYRNAAKSFPEKNFHKINANEIGVKYQIGDTVSIRSFEDAQLINLYLPDTMIIYQKVDTNIQGMYKIIKH